MLFFKKKKNNHITQSHVKCKWFFIFFCLLEGQFSDCDSSTYFSDAYQWTVHMGAREISIVGVMNLNEVD